VLVVISPIQVDETHHVLENLQSKVVQVTLRDYQEFRDDYVCLKGSQGLGKEWRSFAQLLKDCQKASVHLKLS